MSNRIVGAVVAFVVAGQLFGCTQQPSPTWSSSAGTLAISRDDALLFAVDEDNRTVSVLDTRTEQKVADVRVGAAPARVVVAADDTAYVSNRGERTVSVVDEVDGQWQEVAKVDVGIEPSGLALSPDGRTLYVVNAASLESTDTGTLTAIDTRSLQVLWELPVGEEPRGIGLIEGGRKALVTLYKQGELVTVDLEARQVVKAAAPAGAQSAIYAEANRTMLEGGSVSGSSMGSRTISSFRARSAAEVITTPDGQRAFVPLVWSREDAIAAPPSVFGGYYSSGGPCNLGAIATPGVLTVEANAEATPKVDDLTACASATAATNKDYPLSTIGRQAAPGAGPIQGPVTGVVDPTGEWLYVVNRESDNVAIMPTGRRSGADLASASSSGTVATSTRQQVGVGAAPTGIALTSDGRRAYVYSSFDHSISRLEAVGDEVRVTSTIQVATDVLEPEVVAGRKLFFSAWDSRMTNNASGTSCNTCHQNVREDGHVWVFPDGPRQTPSLAGRKLTQTAPYHWSGEFPTMRDFLDHTVRMRMGGSGVTAAMAAQLQKFVDYVPAPDNPFRSAAPTPDQVRGAQVFQKANCQSCHSGEAFTNNTNENVGTLVVSGKYRDATTVRKLNTPSLLGLSRTAPYLHDGSAGTLKERLMATKSTNLHGLTRDLTEQEMDDLVAYLNSL